MYKPQKSFSFLKSLKLRLIVTMVLMAIVPASLVGFMINISYTNRALAIRESEVKSQTKILAGQIAASEFLTQNNHMNSDTLQTQIAMLVTVYDGRILIVDSNLRVKYDTYDMDVGKTIISEEVVRGLRGEEHTAYDVENEYIELAVPIISPSDEKNTIMGVLVANVATDSIWMNADYLNRMASITIAMVGMTAGFLAVLIAIRLLRPWQKLSEDIAKIQWGHSMDPLEVNDYSETITLCERVNGMLDKMKLVDDSRQEFVANVSHELKTPLTSMKVLADSINSMQGAPVELYQEFMTDITNEIERETKIINDLLSLVKTDRTDSVLNISKISMNELLEQIMKRLQPIADKQKVSLVLESFRPVMAEVDEVKITLAITNLIENAIKYNRNTGDGWVHVSLNADHKFLYLKVEDSGMGIPEESLDLIYERFYRVDKSHSREIGGTGLGLAITKNAIVLHKGDIKVRSELGEGTTFDVRLPLNYIG